MAWRFETLCAYANGLSIKLPLLCRLSIPVDSGDPVEQDLFLGKPVLRGTCMVALEASMCVDGDTGKRYFCIAVDCDQPKVSTSQLILQRMISEWSVRANRQRTDVTQVAITLYETQRFPIDKYAVEIVGKHGEKQISLQVVHAVAKKMPEVLNVRAAHRIVLPLNMFVSCKTVLACIFVSCKIVLACSFVRGPFQSIEMCCLWRPFRSSLRSFAVTF